MGYFCFINNMGVYKMTKEKPLILKEKAWDNLYYGFQYEDVKEAVERLKDKISRLNRREDLELSYIDEIFGDL